MTFEGNFERFLIKIKEIMMKKDSEFYDSFMDFEPDVIDELFMEDGVRECLIDMDRLNTKDKLTVANKRIKWLCWACIVQSIVLMWLAGMVK